MDFATLKAYMISVSIKENMNNTIAYGQKRMNVSKMERQTNRNIRLTQFRKIPENISAFPINVTKPLVNNTSKLYEEKLKMRMQRLQEFKEKKENFKREEAAKKKPIFIITNASLEKYDLKNAYGYYKGIPVANLLPSEEPYIFSAPKNVQAINFLRKTPVKEMESPKKRVIRSTTRLQTDKLNEVVENKSTLNKIAERVTTAPKLTRVGQKSTSIDDTSKNLSQGTKTPIKSKKPNNNQRMKSNSSSDDNNDVTLNRFVKAPVKL